MNKNIVTESSDELISKAEKDIINVEVLSSQKFSPEDLMYDIICFHATQAVEKLLKGYIISNGKETYKIHNLDNLCKSAMEINGSFEKIAGDCVFLNTYVPDIKYSEQGAITKQSIKKIIKSLKIIYDFSAIKAMRDSFKKSYKYKIIAETIAKPAVKKATQKPKQKTASKTGKKKK